MINEIFDSQKEIISNGTIGNIGFDYCLSDFEDAIKKSQRYSDGYFSLHPLSTMITIVYKYKNSVLLEFDLFTGELLRIIAINGYKGGLFDKIFVGQKVEALVEFDNSFKPYSTGGLMSANHLGICIYINDRFDIDLHNTEVALAYEITGIGIIRQYNSDGKDLYLDIYGLEHPKYRNFT